MSSRLLKPVEEDDYLTTDLTVEKATIDESPGIPIHPHKSNYLSFKQQRERLPVYRRRLHFLYLLEKYNNVVVVGETGSGKSTQLPQYLLEYGWLEKGASLVVTQPRRVAVFNVASRIAEEREVPLGEDIGYSMRFENCCNCEGETLIKIVTEGTLIREMFQDPLLKQYRIVMLDDVHERSISCDMLLALLKKIQLKRSQSNEENELKLIVSSATLDAESLVEYLGGSEKAAILSVEGNLHPVEVHYSLEPVPCYVKATISTIRELHAVYPNDQGVLAFLTGQDEVLQVVRELKEPTEQHAKRARNDPDESLLVLPLYSGLPYREQLRIFERGSSHRRKVVIATNIAESSITIPGIVHVIDCGHVKLKATHPDSGLECLLKCPISKCSAVQRAGRAGRVRPGKVYRLYPVEEYDSLAEFSPPEIQRCDLSPCLLQLRCFGISNLAHFDFLAPPSRDSIARSLELLFALGALDDKCHVTSPLGLRMSELPMHPMSAAMLFAADIFGCTEEAAGLAALMQIKSVFLSPSNKRHTAARAQRVFCCEEGDHISQLNVLKAFEKEVLKLHSEDVNNSSSLGRWCHTYFLNYNALKQVLLLKRRIVKALEKFDIKPSSSSDVSVILKAFVKGFFPQAAKLSSSGSHYVTIRGSVPLHLHPTSILHSEKIWPQIILFTELSFSNKFFVHNISSVQSEWLYELAPHYYEFSTQREHLENACLNLFTSH